VPKLGCRCGFVHNLSPIPDDGWKTIRDRAYERVIAAHIRQEDLARDGRPSDDPDKLQARVQASQTITGARGMLYQCPVCGRLLWRREGEETFRVYLPETA
jgi:hypothetical protein